MDPEDEVNLASFFDKLVDPGELVIVETKSPPLWIPFAGMDTTNAEAIAAKHPKQKPENVPLTHVNAIIKEYYAPLIKEQIAVMHDMMQEKYFKMLYASEPITAKKVADLLEEYGKQIAQPNTPVWIDPITNKPDRYPYWAGGLPVDYTHGLWLCSACLEMIYGDQHPVLIARQAELMEYPFIDRCSICGPGDFDRKGYKLNDLELSA